MSRRRTDELGSRLDIHSVSISRQQVQHIFRFSLRSRAGARPLSGGTGTVATGRVVSVPSFRE